MFCDTLFYENAELSVKMGPAELWKNKKDGC